MKARQALEVGQWIRGRHYGLWIGQIKYKAVGPKGDSPQWLVRWSVRYGRQCRVWGLHGRSPLRRRFSIITRREALGEMVLQQLSR